MSVLVEVKRLANEAQACRRAASEERDGSLAVLFGEDAREFIGRANELLRWKTVRVDVNDHGPGRLNHVDAHGNLIVDLDEGRVVAAPPPAVSESAS